MMRISISWGNKNEIDPTRIIAQGNGSSKPMYDNDTEEHRALNRRTDVSFKIIE